MHPAPRTGFTQTVRVNVVVFVRNSWCFLEHKCSEQKIKTFYAEVPAACGCSMPLRSAAAALSLWSVDVIDGREELLTSLLVYVRAQANVHQVGELLHGVLLKDSKGQQALTPTGATDGLPEELTRWFLMNCSMSFSVR